MKLFFALLFVFGISAFGQTTDLAKGTYARNGVLIGLTNLVPLKDCRIEAMEGKVKSVKYEEQRVVFELRQKKQQQSFQFDLAKIGPTERQNLRRGFMKKGIPLSVKGYACTEEGPAEAISIDRSYKRVVNFP